MKTEALWKKRFLRFLKLKYMLQCVCMVGIIYVVHQVFYLKELNQANVGKLFAGSLRTSGYVVNERTPSKWDSSVHAKVVRDSEGRNVSLRGTRDQDLYRYLPNVRGRFVCFASEEEIDFSKVNDDYCDCPLDGSDEPGTNACNNGVFHCEIFSSSHPSVLKIPSYKVNDGYCDCCDGSDEWSLGSSLPNSNEFGQVVSPNLNCQNTCRKPVKRNVES